MASIQTNISKGREVELYNRVVTNDPANSALVLMVLATGSSDGVDGLIDFDTFADILAGGYDEVTNTNYARRSVSGLSDAGGGIEVWFDLSSFPMQLEMMRAALVATGQMDIFLTPGIGSSTLDLTNGEGGTDLSGSVSYEYLTGSHNAHVATITIDSDTVVNALWYLLAPRISQTRYKGSITRTAPHKGGTWPPALLAKIFASQAAYGFHQRIDTKDEAGAGFYLRPFYEAQWASEANLIANPKTIASVLPNRGTFPAFRPGDLISVAAGTLQGGFSGAQRVYEFTLTEDADGAVELTDIITSADQETGL